MQAAVGDLPPGRSSHLTITEDIVSVVTVSTSNVATTTGNQSPSYVVEMQEGRTNAFLTFSIQMTKLNGCHQVETC
ncbi:unnamed protein product [Allacma fusca]|uniref:Uncharacterized protein n=1 Tax=Allacma fusca TaxID=39272 RepID=A0A8J2KUW6_9HEXA|nr:unnamed protein product [Allacma fusca]